MDGPRGGRGPAPGGARPDAGWCRPSRAAAAELRGRLALHPERHAFLLSRVDRELAGRDRDGVLALLLDRKGRLRGGAFFGRDRNLAVSELEPELRPLLAEEVLRRRRGLAVAVSPRPEVEALVAGLAGSARPLLHRVQTLYAIRRGDRLGEPAPELERPGAADLPRLAEAALGLAREDLGIPAERMDRMALRRTAARRLERGRSFVLRVGGVLAFKIEVALATPEAALVEGVYTFPEFRGAGLAARGTAALLARLLELHPLVVLHVGRENRPARSAYERAGMSRAGELGLALFEPWR